MLRKINIKEGKYCELLRDEKKFGFCIEDPIDITYNPGYSVLINTEQYEDIIKEFQRAYTLISNKRIDLLFNLNET